jgi:S1-C subfamily serine protease
MDPRLIIAGAIVLALVVGFFVGRAYERSTRYDVYWLLGATVNQGIEGPYLDVVYPGGPASAAGLQSGDHIGAIDGRPMTNANRVRREIGHHLPGDMIQITARRDGDVIQAPVLLGFMVVVRPEPYPVPVEPTIIWPVEPPPAPFPGTSEEALLGVYYRMLEPGDPFGTDDGALIIMAWPGGPADQAGLTAGDIIIAVGDQTLSETRTLQDALSRHSAGETVRLRVLNSEGNTVSMRVRLGGS